MWTPMVTTDKDTGRKTYCTIFEAQLYKDGFFRFADLLEIHKCDVEVRLINR